jgi:NTE family protein
MPAPGSLATQKAQASRPKSRKLEPDDIRYLAFEGGGGKGFAYLGAIDILEKVKASDGRTVMERVEGFAGASAGAITALLLSIGYDFKSLSAFLEKTDFDSFFDPAVPRIRPQVGSDGVEVTETSEAEQAFIDYTPPLVNRPITPDIEPLWRNAIAVLQRLGIPTAASVIASDWQHYFAYLPRDMGLFSGKAARMLFNGLLKEAMAKRRGGFASSYPNVTFEEHFRWFKKKLLVTGTNLRTGTTQLFSVDETPHFPVADAIRISMSLPWVFKPYVITRREDSTDPPCGVYVDGGVWNNLPFRELDSNPPAEKPSASVAVRSATERTKNTPRTLGLRLEVVPAAKIESVFDLTAQMLMHGVVGSGESQVLDKFVDQCIVLDTRGLDLLSFSPPKSRDERVRVLNRSRRAVIRYFDLDIDVFNSRDDADDEATYQARRDAEACGGPA